MFLPVAMSIKDLTRKVLELKPGIEVPRESRILLQFTQLSHFLNNDLDMSAAAVSYPGGRSTDPVERMMSLLNIAMYGVSLERSLMQPVHEMKIKNANTMEEIRTICKDDPDLTDAVTSSIKQCTDL